MRIKRTNVQVMGKFPCQDEKPRFYFLFTDDGLEDIKYCEHFRQRVLVIISFISFSHNFYLQPLNLNSLWLIPERKLYNTCQYPTIGSQYHPETVHILEQTELSEREAQNKQNLLIHFFWKKGQKRNEQLCGKSAQNGWSILVFSRH